MIQNILEVLAEPFDVFRGHTGIAEPEASGCTENRSWNSAEFFELQGLLDKGLIIHIEPIGKPDQYADGPGGKIGIPSGKGESLFSEHGKDEFAAGPELLFYFCDQPRWAAVFEILDLYFKKTD
jgi:hypothetical protein